jgi:[acyl-carrier-protein] S-malonyltransferase
MFEGPADELTLTENTQPALLAASMMAQKVLEAELGKPIQNLASAVAGHSLGEYSALTAAGAFSVENAAVLVRLRGNAMQKAVPVGQGAMAAILGLEMAQVEELLRNVPNKNWVAQIANDNSPGQIVVSGHAEAIAWVIEQAKAMDVKSYAILGFTGGKCKELADVPIHFPVNDMQIAEDMQLIVGHMMMQWLYSNQPK